MATVEERYVTAMKAIDMAGIATAAERAAVQKHWLRATSLADREAATRQAEHLASTHACCTRDAGLIDVQSPGSIKAEMDTTAGVIRQLDTDIMASSVGASFKTAWSEFLAEWEKFYREHLGWLDRFFYSSYEKTVEYRRRALGWRERFVALGGRTTSPPDAPPATASDSASQLVKVALWGGGLYLAAKLVTEWMRGHNRRDDDRSVRRGLNAALSRAARRRTQSRR